MASYAAFSLHPSASMGPSDSSTPFSMSGASSSRALFALGDEYGDEAARELAAILQKLADAGFDKAHAHDYSVFDRILGGLCWVLQRLVKREDAARGRVQWALLFQPHDKMKPRLGLAQDVISRVEVLPVACPVPIQPHQLLLQDFGDIGTVGRLVQWLVELHDGEEAAKGPVHLAKMRAKREYLTLGDRETKEKTPPLKKEVVFLQAAFQPRRKWQYTAVHDGVVESEDAMIQRCLLEYGERVAVHVAELPPASGDDTAVDEESGGDPQKSLLAQLAVASKASAARRKSGNSARGIGGSQRKAQAAAKADKQTRAFEAQYQRIVQQAMAEEAVLLEKQRQREAELLKHVVSVPETTAALSDADAVTSEEIEAERAKLREQEVQLTTLEEEKQRLDAQHEQLQAQATAIEDALVSLQTEALEVDAEMNANRPAQPFMEKLRSLMSKNEALKTQKIEFKANCKKQLETLQARVAQLRLQAEEDASKKDEETLRLQEIEQMHAQLSAKHTEMRLALGRETRKMNQKRKQIDDIPTRIELVQYEKRFLELYDEVALTLDETRKYYSVYNTLSTTQEFLEKEIALINSMHDNFDVAMGSKAATQAFFSQLDTILQNVQVSVRKQKTTRVDFQTRVETLDSKYQVLLEKERLYVNAIREFQKECEKQDKLAAKITQFQSQKQQPLKAKSPVVGGVAVLPVVGPPSDVVI